MIAEAKDIVASSVIDMNHDNSVVFADYVIQIPQGTEVDFDSEDYITLHNCSVGISAGDTFAVYVNNFPCCYKAVRVEKEGEDIGIQITDADDGAIVDMDYQGCMDVDLSTFVPDEGGTYVLNGNEVTESPTERGISFDGKTLRADKKVTFADGMSISVSVVAKNLQLNHNIDIHLFKNSYVYVTVSGDMDYSCNVKCDGWEAIGFSHTLELGSITVWGIGKIALVLEYDMSGDVSLRWETYTEAGFSYYDGCFRLVSNLQKKSFSLVANVNLTAGVKLSADVNLGAVKASIWAAAGAKMSFNHISYETGTPSSCQSMSSFMYANVGASAKIDFGIYKKDFFEQYDIWSLRNSPVRVSYHYEDGKMVSRCTRYDEFVSKGGNNIRYLTSPTSRYFNPMGISGYEGADGNTVSIYEYRLNSEDEAIITKYNGGAAAVNIPSELDGHKVVEIGNGAFSGNKALRTVMIPDSVTQIGSSAFYDCSNLANVTLSKNLKTLGYDAFGNCVELTSIEIPKNLEEAHTQWDSLYVENTGPFHGCIKLKDVHFEEGTTRIAQCLFAGCTGLEEIIIPDTITEIKYNAFGYCSNLKNIIISDSVTRIGSNAFRYCTNLVNVTLSKKLISLGNRSFGDCNELINIEIPKSLENFYMEDDSLISSGTTVGPFAGCVKLKDIKFEEGITKIQSYLFANCTGLEEAIIPDTVTVIEANAFENCSNIKKAIISNGVTSIGRCAFCNCTNLTDVTLSKNLITLGYRAFGDCSELISIEIPKSLKEAQVKENVGIGISGPFQNCTKLKNISFEEGITKIVSYLFAGCTGLEEIIIPDTVQTIGYDAFGYCLNLNSITISEGITIIQSYAFYNCINLTNITIPNTVTEIGAEAFCKNISLTTATLSNKIKYISSGLFQDCSNLTDIIIPNEVTTIYQNAFAGCSSLKSIIIPDSVTMIGDYAFSTCSLLTKIELSKNLKTINEGTFYDCNALTDITIPNSVEVIKDGCFANCEKLKDVHLGTGLTAIPQGCFQACSSLEEIVIPYGVVEINNYAFKNCTKLSAITLPRGLTSINGTEVFSYPEKITIYGINGTYAQQYANDNNIKFVHREIKAESVKLLPDTITVDNGQSIILVMSVEPANFTDEVIWKSSDTEVATISDTGVLRAVGNGTAVIKLTVGDKSANCTVTVVQPVMDIFISRQPLNMEATQVYLLEPYIYPDNASNKQLIWSSDNEAVATVDENGLVTAISKGTAKITATAQDGSNVSGTCTVTVTNNVYRITDIEKLESPHNYEINCNDVWIYSIKDAKSLAVTFDEKTNIEENFDYLYIYDSADKLVGKYTGTALSGITVNVTGDTVKLKLVSDNAGTEWGFRVKQVKADIDNTEIKAETVTIDIKEVTLNSGESKSLTATVTPINCTQKIVWESSDTKVATVSDTGVVNAVGTGTAVIKVTVGDKSASCTVTVAESIKIKYGDVNGDGDINVSDAVYLKKHLAGIAGINVDKTVSDVNVDGEVNISDAVILLKYLAGIKVELGKK